ncbi:MAG: SDR family oxidoreductase [Pseudomonadales bacterium]|nr:SDR family oxidoreductase [Pseudomonadales bacterium]
MDLGISGKKAIVCAASKGLGKGCATALAKEGVQVTICARNEQLLATTAQEIEQISGNKVLYVVADITTETGRDSLLQACPDPDILVNNAGGPPPGDFHDWRQKEWFDALNANMFSAIEMIRRTIDTMTNRGFGRILNITSSTVKAPIAELGLSNGARCGLTGFIAGLARQHVKQNVTVNNLLPGFFDTDRGRAIVAKQAQERNIDIKLYQQQFLANLCAGRMGTIEEFGATCAFLCSHYAGYISGQNILIDGGLYPGTF